ncbi:MAG: TonB family protein, partial [Bacteroidota bacterium]
KKDQLPIEYRIDDRDRIIVYLMAGQSHLNLHKGGDRKFLKVYESDFVITHILDSSPNDKDRTSDFNFSGDSPNGTNWSNYKVSNTRKTITHGTDDELFEEFTDGVDKRLIYTNGRVESRFASSFREEKVKTSFIHPIKDPSKISKETGYGMRMHPIFKKEQLHTGVDYVVPMNTEIVATADGKVVAVKNWQKGYGLHLTVEHQNGYATFYAHLEKALVKVGQSVKQGEVIALSGNTGTSTGPHLHYEVRKDGKAIDFEQEEISRASIYQDIEEEKYSSGSDLLKTQLEIMMMGNFEKRYLQYGSFSSLKLDEDEFNTHINPNFNISLSGEILEQNNGADGLAQFASNHQQTDLEKGYTDFYIDGKQHRFYIYSQQKVASDFAAAFSSPSLSLSERSQMLSKDYQFYTKTFPSNEDDIKNMLFEEISQRGFEFKILKNRTVILLNDEKENLFSTYSEETINALAEFAEYVTKYDLKVIEGNFEAVFHAPNLNLGERSQMLSEDYRLFSSKHSDKKSEIEATLRKVVSARDLRVEISDDRKVILYNDKEKEKENLEIVVTALGNKRVNEPKVLPMTDEIKIPEVDELPRFPSKECEALEITEAKRNCSNQALLKYIYTNIKYPAAARKAGIEGMNVVQFKVMLDGSLEDIRLLRDIGGGCGEEAQRVIEKMNTDNIRWIPGKKDGKNVAVEFTIPVKFKLQGDSKKEGLQEEEIFKVVEEMPRLFSEECEAMATDEEKRKCSQDALLEYLYTNLRYPKAAKDAGVEGMCVVQFTVEKDGSVSDVAVVRDVGVGLGDESARVVEKMNEDSIRWIPGEQRGRTVRVRFTLPIKFDLGALKTAPEKFDPTPKRASQKLQLTNFNIAPNPSNGELRLRFVGVAKPLAIKVYDANGKVIFEEQVQNFDGNFNEQIEVQGSAGVHFLTIEQEGRLFVEQIMIE